MVLYKVKEPKGRGIKNSQLLAAQAITVIKMRTVQRSELALKLKPMLAAHAKERQKIYCGNQYDKKSGLRQNSVQVQKSKTSDDIAKIV